MSRPRRTRVYNSNYNMGESLYKPALDSLDRKYSGRPLETFKSSSPALAFELPERLDRSIEDEDLPSARRRAAKHISEDTIFDSRGAMSKRDGIKLTPALMNGEDEFDEEVTNSLRRIRDSRKKLIQDIDLEGTVSSLQTKRDMGLSDKLLDSVGINEITARRIQNGESSIISKRRSFNFEDEFEEPQVQSKWTALRDEETSAAALRAKQSRARLQDLENEMEVLNERQAARDRRLKKLKAFMDENADESSSVMQKSSIRSAKISARSEKKTVTF